MKYPKRVQEIIDDLEKYKENNNLETFDCFHLYPGELTRDNGYDDSRFFTLWGYNEDTVERRNIGKHDGMFAIEENIPIKMLRIYCDGSTFVRFYNKVRVDDGQCVYFYKV